METLERLRRRTQTAKELLSVVKTMKSLAAANIHEYEQAEDALRQYATTVELGFRILTRLEPDAFAAVSSDADEPPSLVVLGSDRGMVGRFNEEIVEHVRTQISTLTKSGPRHVVAVGARLVGHLDAAGWEVETAIELPGSVEGIVSRVQQVLVTLERWLDRHQTGDVFIAHHRPLGRASHEPIVRMLLPIDPKWLANISNNPWPQRGIPAYTLPTRRLMRALVRQYLLVSLQRAFAQSLAAENAKRLATMLAAEKNVTERLRALHARYLRRRQDTITSELLEVTAGFEVLEKETAKP